VIDIVSVIDDDELLKITTTSPAANVELGTVCPAVTDKTLPTSPTTSVFVELLDTGTFLYPTGLVPSTVQLLSVPDVGVPKTGVVSVGEVDKTTEPDPVDVVTPVPPLATTSVPAKVMVPDVVIGLPDTVRPVVPPLRATEVTVPDPTPDKAVFNAPVVLNVPSVVQVSPTSKVTLAIIR
jgi:hypothetical protein